MRPININYVYISLYIISNTIILLNYNGIYWDDWVIYAQSRETLAIFYDMIQYGIKGDFITVLSKFSNGIYLFRLFLVMAYLLIAYFIYKILITTNIFNQTESKLIAFISVIVPIAPVKTYLIIILFIFPLLIFYFAFYLLAKNYPLHNKSLKVIILFLFLCSFSTNSILVFYSSVLLYLYYMDNNGTFKISFENLYNFFISRWDFIGLPVFYFIYKSLFLVPYGLYDNYNKVSFDIKQIQLHLTKSIETMTSDYVYYLFDNYIVIIASAIIALIVAVLSKYNFEINKKKITILFGMSIVLFFLAIFPYIVVGKTPVLEGVNSRFALLLGPALSMFLISVLALTSHLFLKYKNKVFVFLVSLFIVLFVSKNITEQYNQNIDWFYQVSIMENFKENEIIKNYTTFIVHNNIRSKLHGKRDFRFYGLNGLLKKVFGDTKRLMILPPLKKQLPDMYRKFGIYKQYNFYEWDNNQNPIEITINFNIMPSVSMQAKLFLYYVFSYDKFLQLAKSLTVVAIRK